MLAGRSVEAGVGDLQALDGLASDDVGMHDLVNVFRCDVAVPDGVGIDDDGGTVLALVEASRLVGADGGAGSGLGQAGLESTLEVAGGGRVATATRMIGWALVAADEDVPDELWHKEPYEWKSEFREKKRAAQSGPLLLKLWD